VCPECETPALANQDGSADCPGCGLRFALPKEVQALAKAKVPAFENKAGLIERNVSSRVLGETTNFAKTTEQSQVVESKPKPLAELEPEPSAKRRRRTKKRKKQKERSLGSYLLMFAGLVAVALISFFAILKFQRTGSSLLSVEQKLQGDEKVFFRTEFPLIYNQLTIFFRSQSNVQKADCSLGVPQLGSKMRSYYLDNPDETLTQLLNEEPLFWNVAYEESPSFVEVLLDDGRGGIVESVFVKRGSEWLLDWEQYVRFSEENWALFRKGPSDAKQGVFRLFVEKVDEGEEEGRSWFEVRLYGAIQDEIRRDRESSEIIRLDADSPVGAKVANLFADRIGGNEGFSQLWKRDPKNLRRATLKLAWSRDPETGKDILAIEDILSQHWRTLSDLSDSVEGQEIRPEKAEDE